MRASRNAVAGCQGHGARILSGMAVTRRLVQTRRCHDLGRGSGLRLVVTAEAAEGVSARRVPRLCIATPAATVSFRGGASAAIASERSKSPT